MKSSEPALTKSQVNRAGRTLRLWLRGDIKDPARVDAALDTVRRYRAAHGHPLAKATMGLRSAIKTERLPIEVSQRLKRIATILDKLRREPTMQLANMQDIGGCRALLGTIDELRRVEQRLNKTNHPIRRSDYVSAPRASGYRAVHVVVDYADASGGLRAIEIQLRTRVMHEWATAVETLTGQLQEDLKSGAGADQVQRWLTAIAEAMAIEERGQIVPDTLSGTIVRLRVAAVPYLQRNKNG